MEVPTQPAVRGILEQISWLLRSLYISTFSLLRTHSSYKRLSFPIVDIHKTPDFMRQQGGGTGPTLPVKKETSSTPSKIRDYLPCATFLMSKKKKKIPGKSFPTGSPEASFLSSPLKLSNHPCNQVPMEAGNIKDLQLH